MVGRRREGGAEGGRKGGREEGRKVTTGGFNAALFDPATAFMTWNNQGTSENALYVSDGAGHWFRMSPVAPPETGWLWSPVASFPAWFRTLYPETLHEDLFELYGAEARKELSQNLRLRVFARRKAPRAMSQLEDRWGKFADIPEDRCHAGSAL